MGLFSRKESQEVSLAKAEVREFTQSLIWPGFNRFDDALEHVGEHFEDETLSLAETQIARVVREAW